MREKLDALARKLIKMMVTEFLEFDRLATAINKESCFLDDFTVEARSIMTNIEDDDWTFAIRDSVIAILYCGSIFAACRLMCAILRYGYTK